RPPLPWTRLALLLLLATLTKPPTLMWLTQTRDLAAATRAATAPRLRAPTRRQLTRVPRTTALLRATCRPLRWSLPPPLRG
ncbi:hypothetical protein GGF42_008552, partial [Coemansia sp. RSA 2424]